MFRVVGADGAGFVDIVLGGLGISEVVRLGVFFVVIGVFIFVLCVVVVVIVGEVGLIIKVFLVNVIGEGVIIVIFLEVLLKIFEIVF